LVYDITKKESFESLKDIWYKEVKEQATAGIIFHVAGNKIDLFNNEEVEKKDVEEFCKSINAEFDFISAQEHQFIDELFRKLAEKFLNSDIYKSKESNKKNNKLKLESDDSDNQGNEQKKKRKCCS
jgi:GTPase SAR1 family protein